MRATVPAGDYAVQTTDGSLLAAVERKSLDNLAATLSDGTLAFQMQRLAELPLAAVVVEARYSALYKLEHVNGNWLADQLARLKVRYPDVHLVFADSRRFAEEWTYRFLTTALADASDPLPTGAKNPLSLPDLVGFVRPEDFTELGRSQLEWSPYRSDDPFRLPSADESPLRSPEMRARVERVVQELEGQPLNFALSSGLSVALAVVGANEFDWSFPGVAFYVALAVLTIFFISAYDSAVFLF